jgi:NADH-quinone oxidoreductase subunit E
VLQRRRRTWPPAPGFYSVFYALSTSSRRAAHGLHLPRHRLPHARLARAAERLKLQLGLREDEDEGSADKLTAHHAGRRFTIRTVACFGQCALAPVVEVEPRDLGHVNERA